MKKQLLSLIMPVLFTATGFSKTKGPLPDLKQKNGISFTENKGQVKDQNGDPRTDVLYTGQANGTAYHLRKSGISYQQYQVIKEAGTEAFPKEFSAKHPQPAAYSYSIYRLDLNWLQANEKAELSTDAALPGYTSYYTSSTPALNVKKYSGVKYVDIYKGIDLHFYEMGTELEYDFIVAPFADHNQIKIEIKGASRITLRSDGAIDMETPFGTIRESSPVVLQEGHPLQANWKLENNILSFEIKDRDPGKTMVIDPVIRAWGSYLGDSGDDVIYGSATDANGDLYVCGMTSSTQQFATVGAHQATLANNQEAFLMKFNPAGAVLWGTYYGGALYDLASSCAIASNGDVYLCGVTSSTNSGVISSTGTPVHQVNFGGGFDAFLAKFNSAGVRQWGTYYGGAGAEYGYSCATDQSGNVYACGYSSTTTGPSAIASGGHQNTNGGYWDGFLVKFNSSGARQWGTYYGGVGTDIAYSCAVDLSGNIYLTGQTQAYQTTYPLSTPASHQPIASDAFDAFLAKFNSSGVRQWGTYYGDVGADYGLACTSDVNGDVYMAGYTASTLSISTQGSHQPSIGGNDDGFLAKFNSSGQRLWSTYYGGLTDDAIRSCVTDNLGSVYITGNTHGYAAGVISTYGNHQSVSGGLIDAFLVKLNSAGVRQWGTYYGGAGSDQAQTCALGTLGSIYIGGFTGSAGGTAIATPGSYQTTFVPNGFWGWGDAFFAKFFECYDVPSAPQSITPVSSLNICVGAATSLSVTAPASLTVSWYSSPTSTNSIGTGSTIATPVLSPGSTVYYAETSNTCSPSPARTAITITINVPPTISVNSGSVCTGSSFTITPSGAASYTFAPTGPVLNNLPATIIYTVYGTSAQGCINTAGVFGLVTVTPPPTLTVTSTQPIMCIGDSVVVTVDGGIDYNWSSGETTSSVKLAPPNTTTYSVTALGANGCTASAVFTQSVGACTGIKELSYSSIQIYPNPTNGELFIAVSEGCEAQLFNGLGQELLRKNLNDNFNFIDLSGFAPGIYLVKILKGEAVIGQEKIVVR